MKYPLAKVILFTGVLFNISCSEVTTTPYWEIQDPRLPEIAMIRMIRTGANVVIYNPVICKQFGDACGFFRLHVFAHDRLNHSILAFPADYSTLQETQADCWAAKHGKPHETYAAVQLILDEDRDENLIIHGNPTQRAEQIRTCAMEADNWVEGQ